MRVLAAGANARSLLAALGGALLATLAGAPAARSMEVSVRLSAPITWVASA